MILQSSAVLSIRVIPLACQSDVLCKKFNQYQTNVLNRKARLNGGGLDLDEAGLHTERSLNRVGETAVSDFGTYAVPDPLATAQLPGVSAYVELDLISFVVFDGVNIALDVLDRSTDRPPCRTRLSV